MTQAAFHFPRGFLWGTATAAHQVEGGITNTSWDDWEPQPGRIANNDQRGLACDWWTGGRWREDFSRAEELGLNAQRMSIEWSRVQPEPDRWDEHAIDRYREMVRSLHQRGMTPLVTLHHYTEPKWVAEKGGWQNPEIIKWFERYVRKVVEALKEYVTLWITVNEPNVYVMHCYLFAEYPPGEKNLGRSMSALETMARAHAAAYRVIHSLQPEARVSFTLYYRSMVPAKPWFPLDKLAARVQFTGLNEAFPKLLVEGKMPRLFGGKKVPEAKGTLDFLGIDYYTRDHVSFNLLKANELFGRRFFPKGADVSEANFIANEPEGLFEAVKWSRKFKLPVIITENGVDDVDDRFRRRALVQHIHQLWRAVNFNWPVKGYFHWSLVDNFEWDKGWTLRFGLWELDPVSQVRRKRPSADLYAEIVHENGLTSEVVEKYAPEVLENIFP